MSGAPIIQNGKFIGAITHVLVNDPAVRICGFWRFNDKTISNRCIGDTLPSFQIAILTIVI